METNKPSRCPNLECIAHSKPKGRFYSKKGYYKTKHNHRRQPRFLCKHCGRTFSLTALRPYYRHHRPDLNPQVYAMVTARMTMRGIAKALGIARATVVAKFHYLAEQAEKAHAHAIQSGALKAFGVQMDEMETHEHTRLKPLSVTVAATTRLDSKGQKRLTIIDAQVARMPAKGHIAERSREIYNWVEDGRPIARREVLRKVAGLGSVLEVVSDSGSGLIAAVRECLPRIQHQAVVGADERKKKKAARKKGENYFDPLFWVNHAIAMIRHNGARFARRGLTNTIKADRAQEHLDLWIASVNGYRLV